jgi:hypothetical protein
MKERKLTLKFIANISKVAITIKFSSHGTPTVNSKTPVRANIVPPVPRCRVEIVRQQQYDARRRGQHINSLTQSDQITFQGLNKYIPSFL